jgi:hypothetical protein
VTAGIDIGIIIGIIDIVTLSLSKVHGDVGIIVMSP